MFRSSRVWITRARPGAERTSGRLSALGFTPLIAPLLEIRRLDATIDLTGVQALAFTSPNGVTAFAALSKTRALPVLTVGDATARTAREAGFDAVRSADGDILALADLIRCEAGGLSILHPCAARPAGDLPALVGDQARVVSLPVYQAEETGAAAPPDWAIVLIHSPRAAQALASAASPDLISGRTAVAISAAAAAPLSTLPFADIRVAQAPNENALLATLGKPQVNV